MSKTIFLSFIFGGLILVIVSLAPQITYGQPEIIDFRPAGVTGSLTELINRIAGILFTVAIVLAPILLVIAGMIYMTAGGNPGRVAQARSIIIWTVVGFGLILVSRGLVIVLRSILGTYRFSHHHSYTYTYMNDFKFSIFFLGVSLVLFLAFIPQLAEATHERFTCTPVEFNNSGCLPGDETGRDVEPSCFVAGPGCLDVNVGGVDFSYEYTCTICAVAGGCGHISNQCIAPPVLTWPADNEVITDTTPTLTWNAAIGGFRYKVEVEEGATGTPVESTVVMGTSFTTSSLTLGTDYLWRVASCENLTCTSPIFSLFRQFTEAAAPDRPPTVDSIQVTPSNPLSTDAITFTSTFSDDIGIGAAAMVLEDGGGTAIASFPCGVTSPCTASGGSLSNGSYTLHVNVTDGLGQSVSDSLPFTVGLGVPENPDPATGSSITSTTPNFDWDDVDRSDNNYRIEVSEVAGSLIFDRFTSAICATPAPPDCFAITSTYTLSIITPGSRVDGLLA